MAYAFQRFLQMLVLVFFALLLVFLTQRLAPGGPFDGERPPPKRILENLRAYYDLDLSLSAQFGAYLYGMAGRRLRDDGTPGQVYWLGLPATYGTATLGTQTDNGGTGPLVQVWCPWGAWLKTWVGARPADARPLRKCGILRGDFGLSMVRRSVYVNDYMRAGAPATLKYAIPALLFALGLGIPMGLYAAYHQNKSADLAMVSVGMFGTVVPNLVMAPLLIYLFAFGLDKVFHWLFVDVLQWIELSARQQRTGLNWIPSGRPGGPMHYVLPTLVLGTAILGRVVRLTRAGALEALKSNYVRTARAKGVPGRRILFRHVFKPAILPTVTFLGPFAAVILTGSLVIEQAFSLPGLGRQFITAAIDRDYTLLMGTTVILLLVIIVLNFLVDLTYAWLDPRIRRRGTAA